MTPQEELAYLRTAWALERTQLAWVRTAFAVISAGLALEKAIAALNEARLLEGEHWVMTGRAGGIALTLAASLQLAIITITYYRRDRQMARTYEVVPSKVPTALPLSIAVTLIGLTIAVLLGIWG